MRFKIAGLASAIAIMAAFASASQAQTLNVAVAAPLTGSLAALGEQMKRGADMAVADINAAGGIAGQKLVLIGGDDGCDPKQAVSVANDLARRGVKFVAGHACSGSSIPASEVYAEEGMLQITPASTNPLLTDRGPKFSNVFRTCGRDDAQGAYAAKYIAEKFKGQNVAIAHDKGAYGKGLAEQTKAELNRMGVQEKLFDAVTAGEKDFSAFVTKLKSAQISVLYFGGYHPEAGLILRQAKDQGLKLQLVAGDGLNTAEFWSVAGDAGEGTLFTFTPDARKLPSAAKVVDQFKAQGYDPEGFTLYTYAAFQVYAQAAAKAGSLKLEDVVKAMRAGSFETVIGTLAFDEKGDLKAPQFVMYQWSKGKYAPLG